MDTKQQWFMCNYAALLPTNKDASILEIGPGAGEICELLTEQLGYQNYLGLDVTTWYNSASPDNVKRRIKVVNSVEEFLLNTSATFDLVLMLQCLEHIPRPHHRSLMASIRNRLAESGALVVEVPNAANLFVGGYLRYADTTHEVGFTDCSLEWTLRNAGFEAAEIVVRPLRLPLTSIARYLQWAVQSILTGIQRLLMRAFIPRGRIITSMYIQATARRGAASR